MNCLWANATIVYAHSDSGFEKLPASANAARADTKCSDSSLALLPVVVLPRLSFQASL